MSTQDHELLSRYMDGEVTATERETLEQRLASEPLLKAHLKRMQLADESLRESLTTAFPGPVPATIASQLQQREATAEVLPFHQSQKVRRPQQQPAFAPRWPGFAAAAALVAAIAVVIQQNGTAPGSGADLLAGNTAFTAAMDSAASSADEWQSIRQGREVRAVLTFPRTDGGWCREFVMREPQSDWRGVACREGDEWVTQAIGRESFLSTADAYRPAGAADADQVSRFISQNAADIALSAEQEAELIARNWR